MALRLCLRRYNLLTSSIRPKQRYLSSEPPPFRKQKSGGLPILLASLGFCTAAAGASFWFSDYQKQRIEEQKKEELEKQKNKPNNVMSKGKPLLGGPFVLVDTEGNKVSDKDFLGKWLLIYFGFTFCPDICPEELDKITETVNIIDNLPNAPKIQPIFISVDPKRDTPDLIKTYLEDFHPRFIGLTGSVNYRVSHCLCITCDFGSRFEKFTNAKLLGSHCILIRVVGNCQAIILVPKFFGLWYRIAICPIMKLIAA
eukprot:sb/3468580/